MNGLISIIVPVYNVEKYIERCIDSVINQTYKNLEIILVDDGSNDKSGIICDEYAKKDSRIKVIHKENSGVSNARNKGLDNATGQYIAFIDSDDWIEPDMYEYMMQKMIENNVDMVRCQLKKIYEDGRTAISYKVSNQIYTNMKEERIGMILEVLNGRILPCFSTMLVKKEIIDRLNLRFDSELIVGEDMLFVIELYSHINSIYWCKKVFYNYYIHDQSTSMQSEKNRIIALNYLKLYTKIKQLLVNKMLYNNQIEESLCYYIFYYIYDRNSKYIVDTRDPTIIKVFFNEAIYDDIINSINIKMLSKCGKIFYRLSKRKKYKSYYIVAYFYGLYRRINDKKGIKK